ncbi:hypothetical protein SAY87_016751 [Trapa incisa]|uniref:Uncharacterized protein n=1 Tax=Trapa incisa TaxID=236973 RepID=A0AAN7L934_9MYRT|nr:hypothetical protein SAY87_016751 [Trapa incisa]
MVHQSTVQSCHEHEPPTAPVVILDVFRDTSGAGLRGCQMGPVGRKKEGERVVFMDTICHVFKALSRDYFLDPGDSYYE